MEVFHSIPGYCIQVRDLNEKALEEACIPEFGQARAAPGPRLPASIPLPAAPNTPEGDRVTFLTARGGVESKVEALRAGGDDYVTKPFSLAEIVARVQAILRRTAGDLPGDVLRYGDLVLDEGRHEVFRADTRIELTATEFNLLRFFLLNPRRVLSKGQILQQVWRYDFGGNTNVVETYVSYLRRKLDSAGPPLIRTVRQAGYMLEAEPR